ncbi:MAG: tape measure protein [Candidatus Peribacteria bacterium]|jgi:tape measure domain-containing protein|nr:tape measure protein [Candidatus Peribacteria bacterium]
MLNDLDSFSNKYAQNRQEVLENSKQLLAMGVSANKLLPTMKSLGDVSSALNVDLSRLAYNYGQVRSQGVLTSRDMKDFAMMGVPLIEELAENLGKSNREIKQMMTDGEITFAMVEEAFQTMT